jgi:transcription antitermination factor NusG
MSDPGVFEPLAAAGPGQQWAVLHTRPRCEHKVAALCRERGAEPWLPALRHTRRYGARVRRSEKPLFTGYLFAPLDAAQSRYLAQNRLLANLLPVADEERFLAQLNRVRLALAAGVAVEVLPHLAEGRAVRVAGGALKGLEGRVVRHKGRDRVVIDVDLIGTAVALEIDAALLQPAR